LEPGPRVEHVWGYSFEVNCGKLIRFFIEELKELAGNR